MGTDHVLFGRTRNTRQSGYHPVTAYHLRSHIFHSGRRTIHPEIGVRTRLLSNLWNPTPPSVIGFRTRSEMCHPHTPPGSPVKTPANLSAPVNPRSFG